MLAFTAEVATTAVSDPNEAAGSLAVPILPEVEARSLEAINGISRSMLELGQAGCQFPESRNPPTLHAWRCVA